MTLTSRALREEVANFLTYLIESEIALYIKPVTVRAGRVSWPGSGQEFLPIRGESLSVYRSWLESGQYSALLFDGALLQISYDFAGNQLVGHRLAWVPCPVGIDQQLLQDEPAVDAFDLFAGDVANVMLRAMLRFDFDLARASGQHPAVHFSLNALECRIACAAPLRLAHFAEFVFRNFYGSLWRAHPYFENMPRRAWGPRLVTEEEMDRVHLSWRRE